LLEAYRRGAERFGWIAEPREPRHQRSGKWLVGQGVATAYYPVYRFQAKVRVRISSDGIVSVGAAANEIGTGVATTQIQHIADRAGVPIDKVEFSYGDTALPDSPIMAGGSSQAISIAAAIEAAIEKVHKKLLSLAHAHPDSVLVSVKYEDVEAHDQGLFLRGQPQLGETYTAILRRSGQDFIEVEESSGMPLEIQKFSMASHGAHFCEVRVHEDSGELRIARWVGAFDCGRILNPKGATSQLRGAIVMGIGAALTEEIMFDERRGRIMNPSLAEYHVPVHLDIPHLDVLFLDVPDEHTPLGAHGLAELGITGAAAAVANAVFHATGKRVRELPIRLDKLL
jgi:xanthine dehydrogenase YagR molybdenum-binding subunit